ncbi:hypothetical protein [Marimonas arenosa]|uniref:Uncharacterized protein n=1 Tax=Marimonas arenosa TaxID=1795305 RepID=A0AAE4B371_9RHOB|nr:hypothetical protein [Marimonas arenosa]MDQ2088970.1 hypothetical protein [Marimonas arenosa]
MQFSIKYQEIDWWFWAVIGLTIGLGLAGYAWGYTVALAASAANLLYFVFRDGSLTSFPVQVREVWLLFMLVAMLPFMGWFYILLFVGMLLVVFFDRCGIARVLVMMPWNKGVELK